MAKILIALPAKLPTTLPLLLKNLPLDQDRHNFYLKTIFLQNHVFMLFLSPNIILHFYPQNPPISTHKLPQKPKQKSNPLAQNKLYFYS